LAGPSRSLRHGLPRGPLSSRPLTFYRTPLPGVDDSELQGRLIVIEGPDAVGRSSQVIRLRPWLEELGHAVLDTGMARSALAGKGIRQAKEGNTLGPVTMTLYYLTDFADRLENEIIPALRAGFVVLTDRYIFSIMARAIARGEDRAWIERTAGFALAPHLVLYLRADVKDLISRVVVGKGAFDYWESGMDLRFGRDMYDSFCRYQTRLIRVFDRLAEPYEFQVIDASRSADEVFEDIKQRISRVFEPTEGSPQIRPSVVPRRLRPARRSSNGAQFRSQ
jgi:dTMP kinase